MRKGASARHIGMGWMDRNRDKRDRETEREREGDREREREGDRQTVTNRERERDKAPQTAITADKAGQVIVFIRPAIRQ